MNIKILSKIGIALVLLLALESCKTNSVVTYPRAGKSMPPGQAKKVYGQKSAKAFAPGQQKRKKK